MTRRDVDPLAPLKPVARLAAVGLVALGGVLVAAQFHPAAATTVPGVASGHVTPGGVLGAISVPPGSTALRAKPSGAPNDGAPPFLSGVRHQQTGAVWWSTDLSSADVFTWFRAHPPAGMELQVTGDSAQSPLLGFAAKQASPTAGDPTVYVQTFALPGGRTGIQLSADVTYLPVRTTQEMLPAAAKLVVVPDFGMNVKGPQTQPHASGVTVTDTARIADVTGIIDSLQLVDSVRSCPMDDGSGLRLTFESADGTTLAVARAEESGCGDISLKIGSSSPLDLSGTATVPVIQQIETAIGTSWSLRAGQPR